MGVRLRDLVSAIAGAIAPQMESRDSPSQEVVHGMMQIEEARRGQIPGIR